MKTITLLLCFIGLLLCGCRGDPRELVPGHLRPGNVHEVVSRAGATGDADPDTIALGLSPVSSYTPPTMRLVETAPVKMVWFFRRESLDAKSEREGYWVHTLGYPRFARSRLDAEQTLSLDALHDIQLGPDGRPYRPTAQQSLPHPRFHNREGQSGTSLPWVPAGEEKTRTTVIMDRSAQGRAPILHTVPQATSVFTADGQADPGAVQDVVGKIRAQVNEEAKRQAQLNQQLNRPTVGTPVQPTGGN